MGPHAVAHNVQWYRPHRYLWAPTKACPHATAIAVVEDIDYPHAIGAYWGEVNTTIHKAFGLGGALTNGVMRDLGDLPTGFPVVAGSIGPSHGFVHVRSVGQPVTIFGMHVVDGDLVHADRHGALVIPPEAVSYTHLTLPTTPYV